MKARYVSVIPPRKVRTMVRSSLAPVLLKGAHGIASEWQRSIPHEWPGQMGSPTGNSARSITVRHPQQLTATIGSSLISVKALETGARPHAIVPRKARQRRGSGSVATGLLAWPEERGGMTMPGDPPGMRIRKIAHHPGVKARGYGASALYKHQATLLAELKAALARV